MSRERLEPDDTTTLGEAVVEILLHRSNRCTEKKLRFVDNSVPRKKPKIYKHPRSQREAFVCTSYPRPRCSVLHRVEQLLPAMEKSAVQTAEELKVVHDKQTSLDFPTRPLVQTKPSDAVRSEKNPDSACVEMVDRCPLKCGRDERVAFCGRQWTAGCSTF